MANNQIQQYIVEVQQFAKNQYVASNCNAISFVNTGTVNLFINKYLLLPNQTLSIAGNKNEMDVTQYQLEFDATAVIAGNLTVIKKTYK